MLSNLIYLESIGQAKKEMIRMTTEVLIREQNEGKRTVLKHLLNFIDGDGYDLLLIKSINVLFTLILLFCIPFFLYLIVSIID